MIIKFDYYDIFNQQNNGIYEKKCFIEGTRKSGIDEVMKNITLMKTDNYRFEYVVHACLATLNLSRYEKNIPFLRKILEFHRDSNYINRYMTTDGDNPLIIKRRLNFLLRNNPVKNLRNTLKKNNFNKNELLFLKEGEI